MLYFIVVWLVLLVVCSIVGSGTLNGLRVDCFDRMGDRSIVALWLGLMMMSIALLVTSWFLPLSPLTGIALAAVFCGLSLSFEAVRSELVQLFTQLYPKHLPLGLMLFVGITVLMMQPVTWIDSGYYHAQAIQWFGKFGAVPGLALLFDHLGFTSSWFAFAAPLNADSLEGRVLATTNGFALLLALLHCGVSLSHVIRSQAKLSDWFIICFSIILLPIIVRLNHILAEIFVSPSPDIPVLFVTGTIAWSMIAIAESNQKFSPQNRMIPLILAGGAVTLKLVAIPLLFVTGLFYLFNPQLQLKDILFGSSVLIVLLSPTLIQGVIISGCPVYPSTLLCLDLPWTPDAEAVSKIAKTTHQWLPSDLPASSDLGTRITKGWAVFRRYVGNPKIVVALIGASVVSLIGLLKVRKQVPGAEWIALLAVVGINFFSRTSPMMRFWITYLSLLPIFWLAIYCRSRFSKLQFAKVPHAALVVPLFLTTILLLSYSHTPTHLVLPPVRPTVSVSSVMVNQIAIRVPNQSAHCWATSIPCVPKDRVPTRIQLRDRDRGIAAGFVRN